MFLAADHQRLPYLAVDFQVHPMQAVPVLIHLRGASSSPTAEIVRIPPSPLAEPAALGAAARGSGKIFGVTTSVLVVLNDRLISTSPNASATWTQERADGELAPGFRNGSGS